MSQPAIFLDRDGVLNENRADHVKSWSEFRLIPGAIDALIALARLDLPIFVITNQAAINRNEVPQAVIDEIHERFATIARRAGARIDGIFFCPHTPDESCSCRKPRPGLLLQAAALHDIDLRRSIVIGDAHSDIVAGRRAGCRTILVLTGRGRESIQRLYDQPIIVPDAIVSDIGAAVSVATWLLGRVAAPGRGTAALTASFPAALTAD
jgi:D-glycero-D-manno-heptose 1,7-bisphosphate phosphatase